MDLDIAFSSALVRAGTIEDVQKILYSGFDAEWVRNEDQRKVVRFVLDYAKEYKSMPTAEMVEGKLGVKIDTVQGAPGFFLDEVINRQLHATLSTVVKKVIAPLEARDPKAALAAYEEGLRTLRDMGAGYSRTVSLLSYGQQFLDFYDKLKAGFRGVQTPWPSINESTLGFWPEDLILFVARLGIGKTWTLVQIARHAYRVEKKKTLLITTEMSQIKIAQRFYAVDLKVPYDDLRRGKLTAFVEDKFRQDVLAMQAEDGLYIAGGDFDFRIESLEAAIQECEPDLLIIDGVYLLKVNGDGRTEKAANTFDEVKRVAKRNHIPVVISTQFNREAKANKASSVSVEKIALSDAAGWNADLVYGLVQTEDMKRDKRLIMKPLKFREGVGEDIECWWDFDTMNFDELPKGPGGPVGGMGSGGGGGGGKPIDTKSGDLFDPFGGGGDDSPF
jgi:replicative DNA helicase